MKSRWTWGRLAVVGYALLLAAGLLAPQPPLAPEDMLLARWARGTLPGGWLADAGRNVLLFMPVGLAVAGAGFGLRRALGLAIAISVTAELLQLVIPGRYPSVIDVVSNGSGGVLGCLVHRNARRILDPAPDPALRLSLGASAVAIGLGVLWTIAVRPIGTDADYYGSWIPELGAFAKYDGQVEEAMFGEVPIARGGPQPDTPALREAIATRAPWRVRLRAGRPPSRVAPIIAVHDGRQREIALVAADGPDLLLRTRTIGAAMGFERPTFRVRDALAGWQVGRRATIDVEREAGGIRLAIDGGVPTVQRHSIGRSWAVWLPAHKLGERTVALLDAAWLAGLVVPAAFWARRRWGAWLGLAAVPASMALAAQASGLSMPTTGDAIALVVGTALGIGADGLRRRMARLGRATDD